MKTTAGKSSVFSKASIQLYFPAVLSISTLVLQNLVIFWKHYFQDYGFPWDFPQGYYAVTAFWTTLVSQGENLSWVPFHAMGKPINLMLQSGIHYPPFWIFPTLRIEYSLHAAVVVQCLHIAIGAIGMFLFLRLIVGPSHFQSVYAFSGAFVFQFFGGFYSNAQHPDIVRAFAFAPWLFYLFTVQDTKVSSRFFLISPAIWLIVTGSYPGNIVSGGVVIGFYVLLQFIRLLLREKRISKIFHLFGFISLMTLLGVGMSLAHIGPAWLFKDYLLRSEQASALQAFSLGIEHLPSLYLDNALLPGEISMTSTYITLPALIVVSYVPFHIIKKHWHMVLILIFSVFMAAGSNSFLWFLLTRFIKLLQLSRFPSSDYRIFISISLIYFVVLSIRILIENGISIKVFLFRSIFVFLWFFQGIYVSYSTFRSDSVYTATAILVITTICLAALVFLASNYRVSKNMNSYYIPRIGLKSGSVFLLLLILIALDANRVLRPMGTWQIYPADALYQINQWPLEQDGRLLTYKILQNTPVARPARVEKLDYMDYSWEGYITGRYTMNSFYTSDMLKSSVTVSDDPLYKEYMLKEWKPLLFEAAVVGKQENSGIEISPDILSRTFHSATSEELNNVRQTRYGISEIEYEISLQKPLLMMENEIYFPGWKATLVFGNEEREIEAVSVNDVFRAWVLPEGNYKMISRFELPIQRWFVLISTLAGLTWLILTIYIGASKFKGCYQQER